MRFNITLLQEREIIFVTDNYFGVSFTHWASKWASWTLLWCDVLAIDAMQIEPAFIGLGFFYSKNKWRFVVEDMENWDILETAVRNRYKNFNWENFEKAKGCINTRFSCWKKEL